MNVWTALPRLLVSSKCPHNVRFLVEESLSSRIRHYSTNTPVSSKPPDADATQFSDLLKEALARADSKVHTPNSAPRLPTTSNALTLALNSPKSKNRLKQTRRKKKSQERKKAASKNNTDSTKSKKRKSPELTAEPIPPLDQSADERLQKLERELTAFPTEKWSSEPWWTNQENDVDRPEEIDRSPPPHILQQVIFSEGKLKPSVTSNLVDVPTVVEHLPVARLCHGLERVLFNPGVHWLRDPHSGVYNFTPWLENIPKVNDFAFERLTGFISSSRDEELRALAMQENKRFAGSTSSLSGMLSHIYFLISEYKEVDLSVLSQNFKNQPARFTSGQMMPTTVLLNYKDGVYAIDSRTTEWDDPDKNILTWLGTLLENFLTKPPKEFKSFLRASSDPVQDVKPFIREAYRFAKTKNFVMRSQLDCQDPRLPGTGVFDIKTRACISLRMDILNYEENSGYLIRSQHGFLESFEREYYDLIRSAFLKYSFQARIGNMDGVVVAYHNTERLFGFQYVPLQEMDERLFGPEKGLGDKVFNKCIGLLEAIIPVATICYPEQSVRCTFETVLPGKVLTVFVQPDDWTGDEEKRPMKKINVTVEHFLDSVSVRGPAAMRSTDDNWTIKYKIGISYQADSEIYSDYEQVMARKKRTMTLPSSVSPEEAEKYWDSIVFHRREGGEDVPKAPFRPEGFTTQLTPNVERYRELSREGRLHTEQMAREEAGRPKMVLGEGVYVPEDDD